MTCKLVQYNYSLRKGQPLKIVFPCVQCFAQFPGGSQGNTEVEKNKTHCFPQDQSLRVFCYSSQLKNRKKTE